MHRLAALALVALLLAGCAGAPAQAPAAPAGTPAAPAATPAPAGPAPAAGLPPALRDLNAAVAKLAGDAPFPLFVPTYLPAGVSPGAPTWDPSRGLELQSGGAGRPGFSLFERRPTAQLMETLRQHPQAVTVGGRPARARPGQQGAGSRLPASVALVRDGTWIGLDSFDLPLDELLKVAASLQTVPGSHAPVPLPAPEDVAGLRQWAPFVLFVPTRLPAGVAEVTPVPDRDGPGGALRGVTLVYRTAGGDRALLLTQRPADGPVPAFVPPPARALPGVMAESGVTVRLQCQDSDRCQSAWWVQNGTYLGLETGPGLTARQADLLAVAASVSAGALPRDARADLPPLRPEP